MTNEKHLAWVTGGATGIGLASAKALARSGYRVAISGRRAEVVNEAVEAIVGAGLDAVAAPVDVIDADAMNRTATQLVSQFGPIEVLMANAGTNIARRFWRELDPADFAKVVSINLNGVTNAVVPVLPGMRKLGHGTIVVVSSWAGWRFAGFTGAAYGASKHGLAPLVETINDQEGRNGIRATLICPGEVATPILRTRPIPPSDEEMARMLQPDDVAEAVTYIANAPERVCINELVISPTWNRVYIGSDEFKTS